MNLKYGLLEEITTVFNALHWASHRGHKDVVEFIVNNDKRVDLQAKSDDGQTALGFASNWDIQKSINFYKLKGAKILGSYCEKRTFKLNIWKTAQNFKYSLLVFRNDKFLFL